MLTIGRIDYANCTPLFDALEHSFPSEEYRLIRGVPAKLNSLLFSGEVDVCPSSSIEYAYHPDRYLILPHLSISSGGPVASVLLFSRCYPDMLDGQEILLSSESATSVNLLKILMARKFGCRCRYKVTSGTLTEALAESPALLLIGDAALQASINRVDGVQVYDLGELWNDWTGLPFVFALWLANRQACQGRHGEMSLLASRLVKAKQIGAHALEEIATRTPENAWMGRDRLISYWQDNISYELEMEQIEGLKLFYKYSMELGLINKEPQLRFFS